VLLDHQIDSVIHFERLKAMGESVALPIEIMQTTCKAPLAFCRLCKRVTLKSLFLVAVLRFMANPSNFPNRNPSTPCHQPLWAKQATH
jgi:UDP-glucose 4-epimerase